MKIRRWLAAGAGAATAAYATYVATTWLRYGHAKRASGAAADVVLDEYMPDFDVCDRHELALEAPVDATFAAAKAMDFDSSRIVRAIFKGRELLMRSHAEPPPRREGFIEQMKAIGWGVLAELPGREIVMGAVTKPWEATPVFRPLPPEEFAAFAEPDHVKIAWTLRADPTPDGASVFRTETRAVATDPAARKKFRRYWSLLSPGIILIRVALLPALKAAAERNWRVDGDELLSEVDAQLTHAITIDAPPSKVWPWLLQMGCQRAGWYSWDRLDNAGVKSADHIIPELQKLEVGDILPARPVGADGFKVLRITPERALILGSITPDWDGTWAFVLEPLGADRTRLVTRYRAAFPPSKRMAMLVPAIASVHAFMEKKQLRTLKHHAERLHETS